MRRNLVLGTQAAGRLDVLHLLGEVFWVLAGDVYAPDFVFSQDSVDRFVDSDRLAHLWLVPNPPHNPRGDFGLSPDGRALNTADGERFTYSTIGLYRRALFEAPWCDTIPGNPQGTAEPLAPLRQERGGHRQQTARRHQEVEQAEDRPDERVAGRHRRALRGDDSEAERRLPR